MEFDVVVVGAGPSGLATAIRLKQLAQNQNKDLSICVVEKGAEVGAHILSGAVIDPRGLAELIPDWKEKNAPLKTEMVEDEFVFLTHDKHLTLPVPKPMRNHHNYIISLGELCQFLAKEAEALDIEIYPGFAASELLYHEDGAVKGIATGNMGVDAKGNQTEHFEPGMELHAKQTVLAEGCRGSLTKLAFEKFNLRENSDPQTYGIGLKEIWRIKPEHHKAGRIMHSIGWPLENDTYGGSFIYHMEDNLISVGFVVGLDYKNPYLSPFEEFQRFKTHPYIRNIFEGAERLSYGSRALNEGGLQSLPKLTFAGGLIVGDAAGFLNVPKIKGIHTAIKSGIEAANGIMMAMAQEDDFSEVFYYPEKLKQSWLWSELKAVRNIRPGFKYGLWPGLINAALETYVFRGHSPWTLKNHWDHECLTKAENAKPIAYPKPDGKITFDRLSSVFISNTNHAENQPCHLQLKNPSVAIDINYKIYASPETRYCPAGVYEIVEDNGKPKFQINAQNCVHCKSCDIKDPTQNINWVPPEGGGGPNYSGM